MAVFGLVGAGIIAMGCDVAGNADTRPFTRLVFVLLAAVEVVGAVAGVAGGTLDIMQGLI
jgi:hypothetical protein